MKQYDIAETGLNVLGIMVSVEDLTSTINLILLIVSLASLILRGVLKVYSALKERNAQKAIDSVTELREDMEKEAERLNGNGHKDD